MQESRRQRPGSGRVCGCAECLQAARKQKHIPNTEDGRRAACGSASNHGTGSTAAPQVRDCWRDRTKCVAKVRSLQAGGRSALSANPEGSGHQKPAGQVRAHQLPYTEPCQSVFGDQSEFCAVASHIFKPYLMLFSVPGVGKPWRLSCFVIPDLRIVVDCDLNGLQIADGGCFRCSRNMGERPVVAIIREAEVDFFGRDSCQCVLDHLTDLVDGGYSHRYAVSISPRKPQV